MEVRVHVLGTGHVRYQGSCCGREPPTVGPALQPQRRLAHAARPSAKMPMARA